MKDWNEITIMRILLVILGIICIVSLLPGCISTTYVTEEYKHTCELMERGQACLSDHSCCEDDSDEVAYWRTNYTTTEGLYYYNNLPYWGYYSGYYYYYGYRHIYPWWYYYNYTPSYHYSVTTHVHCHIGNNGYVYRPRGNWRHNNKTHLTYHHDNINTTGIKVKNKSNVPLKWRNNNVKIKTNTKIITTPNRNTKVKTNINNTRPNNNTKIKTNRSNNTKTNRTNTKVNTNKSYNKNNTNKTNRSTNRVKTNKRPR